jgi:tetratricopeptide (TPR) repeat protein
VKFNIKGISEIRFFLGLSLALIVGATGCATSNPSQNIIAREEYRKIMARQKAEIAADEKTAKKVPEMTAEGYERLGDRYLNQGNLDLAFMQYHKALQLDSGQLRVRYKMARLFLAKGLKEEAKAEFKEILSADPRQALAYEGLGQVDFQMGEYPEAEKNFKQALDLDPSLWQAHNFLGVMYDRQGQGEKAVVHYQAAIAIQPGMGTLFNNLGTSLLLKGENEKAVAAFVQAVRLEPSNPKTYSNLALGLGRLERYPEALEAFKKGGDEASAHYNMGCIYLWKGKYGEAIAAFEKAIEMRPGFYVKAYEKVQQARKAAQKPAQS